MPGAAGCKEVKAVNGLKAAGRRPSLDETSLYTNFLACSSVPRVAWLQR